MIVGDQSGEILIHITFQTRSIATFPSNGAGDMDLDLETVAVQPPALVVLRQPWQQVRGFKLKRLSQFDFHKLK